MLPGRPLPTAACQGPQAGLRARAAARRIAFPCRGTVAGGAGSARRIRRNALTVAGAAPGLPAKTEGAPASRFTPGRQVPKHLRLGAL